MPFSIKASTILAKEDEEYTATALQNANTFIIERSETIVNFSECGDVDAFVQSLGFNVAATPIKKGGFGAIYPGFKSDGTPLVVKAVMIPSGKEPLRIDGAREIDSLDRHGGRTSDSPAKAHVIEFLGAFCCVENSQVRMYGMACEQMKGDATDFAEEQGGTLKQKQIQVICYSIFSALKYMHRFYWVHRDIKPENFFLNWDGETVISVKLGDMGQSRSLTSDKYVGNRNTIGTGTLIFNSPEQFNGNPSDRKSDIFSACAAMHYLATKRELPEKVRPDLIDESAKESETLMKAAVAALKKEQNELLKKMPEAAIIADGMNATSIDRPSATVMVKSDFVKAGNPEVGNGNEEPSEAQSEVKSICKLLLEDAVPSVDISLDSFIGDPKRFGWPLAFQVIFQKYWRLCQNPQKPGFSFHDGLIAFLEACASFKASTDKAANSPVSDWLKPSKKDPICTRYYAKSSGPVLKVKAEEKARKEAWHKKAEQVFNELAGKIKEEANKSKSDLTLDSMKKVVAVLLAKHDGYEESNHECITKYLFAIYLCTKDSDDIWMNEAGGDEKRAGRLETIDEGMSSMKVGEN